MASYLNGMSSTLEAVASNVRAMAIGGSQCTVHFFTVPRPLLLAQRHSATPPPQRQPARSAHSQHLPTSKKSRAV